MYVFFAKKHVDENIYIYIFDAGLLTLISGKYPTNRIKNPRETRIDASYRKSRSQN